MAMGKRKGRQGGLWVATQDLARTPGHPFYKRLNHLLAQHGFDRFVEQLCQAFYASGVGRPSLPPAVYFRLLLIGYFEGIDSERGIAWRVADSLTLRDFLGLTLSDSTPDHSTISRNRRLIDLETHQEVFGWVLKVVAENGLLKGKTLGVDATTLEANAAMRNIVRRDNGESYPDFLRHLSEESGEATPTRAELSRQDRNRKGKASNADWKSPQDPDARIAKMKDGATHLAHKAEHAVDLETGAVVAVTIQPADRGDCQSLEETVSEALENLETATGRSESFQELVADRGYHSGAVLTQADEWGLRTYIAEPKRPRRRWRGRTAEQKATYANRRRIRQERGRQLARWRTEKLERTMAHAYETGNLRRLYLRGRDNVLKRVLIHAAGLNFERQVHAGVGCPRDLLIEHRADRAPRARLLAVQVGVADVAREQRARRACDAPRDRQRVAVERLEQILLADQPQLLAMPVVGERLDDVRARVHELVVQLLDELRAIEHDLGHIGPGLEVAAALELEQIALRAQDGPAREPLEKHGSGHAADSASAPSREPARFRPRGLSGAYSSALTRPERSASIAISARRSKNGISLSPNERARCSSSVVTVFWSVPRFSAISSSASGDSPSPSPSSGWHSSRRICCCCWEKRGVALSSPGTSVISTLMLRVLQNCDRRLPAADEVAVLEPALAVEADLVDEGAVLRPAVVVDGPLARAELELRVQARDLTVPRQRNVGLEAAADGQRARGLDELDEVLLALVVAVGEERRAPPLGGLARLELRRGGGGGRRGLHGLPRRRC